MDGSINFSGTLAGSIADSGGGKIQDVQTNASGEYTSIVDEQGVAKIDLSNYATREQLQSAIDTINSVLLTKQNVVNYSTEEQNIGIKWIDDKPIYQKTYELQSEITVTNTWDWTSLGISAGDIETYVSVVAQNNSGTCWVVNCATVNGNIAMSTGRNQDTIGVKKFTILYTKTTD